ncbi:glycosyltransferase family 8 protein [Campylobacter sp. MIT 97-5078]|uniref:glycosyltransferase family 8 protein n=1 Tax=Campylobacter sp. MIT 97-5078 TaxID=1548153 RepID=UPI00116065FB|nr:glycosyltransferase family 8 protein [Campylobacter sp. MIT 97-5078]TQR23255.1 glycosyltransferase family 8 protein [Campylobacter sp. MIT 97-5078]
MLNICFGVSEEYVKYAAVVMTSIVKNTDLSKTFADICQEKEYENPSKDKEDGYAFHIFTENCSKDAQLKLQNMIADLNKIYPCNLIFHTVDINDFDGFSRVPWSNHAAMFYKIQAPRILNHIDKCLFLGADTLCVGDIRELFAFDLKDNIIAAAWDCNNYHGYVRIALNNDPTKPDLRFDQAKYYINNDVMLINIEKWKSNNIEEKCAYYLRNYKLEGILDVFPLVTAPKIHLLSNKWNLMVGIFTRPQIGLKNTFKDECSTPVWNYTQQDLLDMLHDVKIVQFCNYECYKPWANPYDLNFYGYAKEYMITYPFYNIWWMLAFSIDSLRQDFEFLRLNIEKKALDFYSQILKKNTFKKFGHKKDGAVDIVKNHLSYRLGQTIVKTSFNNFYKQPFKLYKDFKNFKQSHTKNTKKLEDYADYEEAMKIKSHLSYQVGNALIKNPLIFPFKVLSIYSKFKKKKRSKNGYRI